MSYHVKRAHLIGDKPLPYELPCRMVEGDIGTCLVEVVTPSGMRKEMRVPADQVYFKLESVK